MKKVLVTGGLGFIGSNLVESLSTNNRVVVVDNLSSQRKDYQNIQRKNKGVEYIFDCFASEKILKRIRSAEFDCIFHLAAFPRVSYSVEYPVDTTQNNVFNTIKLIEASVGNTRRFVFSSSSSVYGGSENLPTDETHKKQPKSPYAWQKSCIEDFLIMSSDLYDLDSVSLRYFNVFGPGQYGDSAYATAVSAWCHAIKNNMQLRKDGTGEQTRDMCYVDNVVQANILAQNFEGTFKGESLNVACAQRVSNNEILEFLDNNFNGLKIKHSDFRPGDVMHTLADIDTTKKILGYSPEVYFWEGLEKTLSWWGLSK